MEHQAIPLPLQLAGVDQAENEDIEMSGPIRQAALPCQSDESHHHVGLPFLHSLQLQSRCHAFRDAQWGDVLEKEREQHGTLEQTWKCILPSQR